MTGFETWFAPLSLPEFSARIQGRSVLHVAGPSPALKALVGRLASWTTADLLARHDGDVQAWFHTLDGRHTTARVSPRAARELYDAGITLYMEGIAEVQAVKDEVAACLGLPRESFFGALFCNKPNATSRAHFDPVDIFCVQLRGSKRWWVSKNDQMPAPLQNWATLDPPAPDLRLITSDPLPTDIPEGAEAHDLVPGSLLYVPRGHWHKTFSGEESMSLHIGYSSTTNLDIVLHALRTVLLRERAFRESPPALGDPSKRGETVARLRHLLGRARAAMATIDAEDIVVNASPDAAISPSTRFTRNGLASMGVESWGAAEDPADVHVNVHGYPSTRVTRLELSNELAAATLRLSRLDVGHGITAREAAAADAGISEEDALELLALLETAGLVRRTGEQAA